MATRNICKIFERKCCAKPTDLGLCLVVDIGISRNDLDFRIFDRI
jgi:hypothetical protein